ncbi:Zinc finger CCCH-type antiviral protein 1 [Frankliniella fusca]|uniref:Zinc finger CCCH-type antiviral protein 1 n=1 Tax=Frankliniella fusca TaxID=407009 RepID=A0AAE1HVG4_9NEOP|nr:Zinc finger CCCH-type antiviral protein 1 [Frankliniella fusca]KAK3920408.1 Zinc finger CCCH-type antiviral protein 1 [Frankliniella fusca]KAK3928167.1 Zinc finger CCCH-type antiviral protein 1 [Frankliniella fusca]KAK3928694.1 Zinc finger CCCH-type antiviral protein 1 [Frankliniella fusca]
MNFRDQNMEVAQVLEINEMNLDFLKIEPKEEVLSEQNINVAEEEISSTYREDRELMLIRQSSHDLALISDLYSLMEDCKTMASSGKSLLCCQPPVCQAIVVCPLCGENFMAKGDRLLKLCKHFECVHPKDASELILEAMERYGKLISHMRKALEFDEWFVSTYYKRETEMSLPSYM